MAEKKRYTSQARYNKRYMKRYTLACCTRTEQDIIERVEAQENKNGYIKGLIRADIGKREDMKDEVLISVEELLNFRGFGDQALQEIRRVRTRLIVKV